MGARTASQLNLVLDALVTEVPLNGGRTTSGVVRIGETVHRPRCNNAAFVHKLLSALAKKQFPHSPKYLGVDAEGREVLSYIEGTVPPDLGEFSLAQIKRAGSILASLHRVTGHLDDLKGDEEVICHGDASPCNYVFRSEMPVALIDFDAAFPGPKALDFGYGSWLWSNLGSPEQNVAAVSSKLRAYMAGYGEPVELCLEAIPQAQDWLFVTGSAKLTP